MQTIRYYERLEEDTPANGACVRVHKNAPWLPKLQGAEQVWIETADAEAALEAAAAVRRPTLNSLAADEAAWAALGADALRRFEAVVLLPFRPGAAAQRYEDSVAAVFDLANRYGVPPERRIIDVCVMPRSVEPDTAAYERRIAWLREAFGARTCGGVNNYVYQENEDLLPDVWSRLSRAGMTYGIVSARLAERFGW
ncbi:hypothetical protein [Paenibacillus sp.]|uniref:hypothetical protein n=1 Tax=Paenibacillus sp. TaxID=58172 RepID=UPI002D7476A5|nr:hypothetical protein [Paenibacillus sp.]HZG84110.1 hypothetical protein [Paenibacillus sp.]